MKIKEFEDYLREIGQRVEVVTGSDNQEYVTVRDAEIPQGGLKGTRCDVAILRNGGEPYVPPAAIHTRPALVEMTMTEPIKTQASAIGPEWQYWSRRFDRPCIPQILWAHIMTVLSDPRWKPK